MNRLSLRARLTVMFVATVAGVGLALIGIVYAYLRLTPVPFQAVFGADADAPVIDAAVPVTQEILARVLTASLTVLAVMTALAGALGWFVAGRVLAPLHAIATDARAITSGETTKRIAYCGPGDEVGQLAGALNTMLDSLAASLAAHKRFAANASHELKTPITTIQTLADVALSDPHATSDDLRGTLTRIREVNAGNADTVSALLSLADVQSGRPLQPQRVDVGAICRRVARDHNIPQAALPQVLIDGDPKLIHTAIDNLTRNAVTHGPSDAATITLRPVEGTGAEITVRSGGAVLSPDDVARMAEPFAGARQSRQPSQRTGKPQGHGLGLALTRAIAEAHGGALALTPADSGGLVATLQLYSVPAVPSASAVTASE